MFALWLTQSWETRLSTRAELPPFSDAAIVLGGLSDGGNANPEHVEFNRSAERLTEALQLWREGRVGAFLITSGSGDLMRPRAAEAPGLGSWLHAQGVPWSDIVVEVNSRNTLENATLSLPLARAQGWSSFVLVTSAFHMPRSLAIFRKAGFSADGRRLTPWSVDTQAEDRLLPFNLVADPNSLMTVQMLLKEVVGYAVYALQGYL